MMKKCKTIGSFGLAILNRTTALGNTTNNKVYL